MCSYSHLLLTSHHGTCPGGLNCPWLFPMMETHSVFGQPSLFPTDIISRVLLTEPNFAQWSLLLLTLPSRATTFIFSHGQYF